MKVLSFFIYNNFSISSCDTDPEIIIWTEGLWIIRINQNFLIFLYRVIKKIKTAFENLLFLILKVHDLCENITEVIIMQLQYDLQ